MIEESLEAARRIHELLSGAEDPSWADKLSIDDLRLVMGEFDRRGQQLDRPYVNEHQVVLDALSHGLARDGGRLILHYVPGLQGQDYFERRWMAGVETEGRPTVYAVGEGSRQVIREVITELGWLDRRGLQ